MKFLLTLASFNKKTGPRPVSTTTSNTCPDACPLKAGGCYAKRGPLRLIWNGAEKRGMDLDEFCTRIRRLPRGQLWRHNQAGDLPGEGDKIDTRALGHIVGANTGKRGFTYTHKPPTPINVDYIREANRRGFCINWSADSLKEADELLNLHAGPVVTIVPSSVQGRQRFETPGGRRVVICPATYNENVTCATCELCAWVDRDYVIGFPAHGSSKAKVDLLLRSA